MQFNTQTIRHYCNGHEYRYHESAELNGARLVNNYGTTVATVQFSDGSMQLRHCQKGLIAVVEIHPTTFFSTTQRRAKWAILEYVDH